MAGAVGLSVMKNEGDIVEAMVRHNLNYVDRMHVVDNGSSDDTVSILQSLCAEGLSVTYEIEDTLAHRQTAILTKLVNGRFADSDIVLLDADEFIIGDPADMPGLFADGEAAMSLPWVTYLATRSDDKDEPNPLKRITHRRDAEYPQYFKATIPRSMERPVEIAAGSHKIEGRANRRQSRLKLAHFPVRSAEQIAAKALIGSWNLQLRVGGRSEGFQWREIAEKVAQAGLPSEEEMERISLMYAAKRQAPVVNDPVATNVSALRYTAGSDNQFIPNIARYVRQLLDKQLDKHHGGREQTMTTIDILNGMNLPRIEVVDIGASDLVPAAPPPYDPLLELGLARLTGFEPNRAEFEKLPQTSDRRHLPFAIGDGSEIELKVTATPGFTSTLTPNASFTGRIARFAEQTEIRSVHKMASRRLDDLEEIERIDFLKIDIQGGETAVFAGGAGKLGDCLCVHTEVAFNELYVGQPSFADQHAALTALEFELLGFHSLNAFPNREGLAHLDRRTRRREFGQLVDGDAVYVASPAKLRRLGDEALVKLFAIALHCYRAISYSLFLLKELAERGVNTEPLIASVKEHHRL